MSEHLFAAYDPTPHPAGPRAWSVRLAGEGDAEVLVRLRVQRDSGDPAAIHASVEREFAQIREGAPRQLWIAETAGVAAGFARAARVERSVDADPRTIPAGWYLGGVIVDPAHRRRGAGRSLTRVRMEWLAERATECYFVASALNRVTLALHEEFGFEEVTRDFLAPGVEFTGGVGVLLRAPLGPWQRGVKAFPAARFEIAGGKGKDLVRHPLIPVQEQPPGTPAPLAPVARPGGLAVATFALAFGIGLYQLARSNRPHELTMAPYVAGLLAVTLVALVVALRRLEAAWSAREEHPLTSGHMVLTLVLVPLAFVSVLLFFGSMSTAIEVLTD